MNKRVVIVKYQALKIPNLDSFMAMVNLETRSKDLQDVIVNEYPGKIFAENYDCMRKTDGKVFKFLRLSYETLHEFTEQYKGMFDFQIRDSETGKLLEESKEGMPVFFTSNN